METASSLIQAGFELQKRKKYGEAAVCYRRALARESGHIEALGRLATVLSLSGKHKEALDYYQDLFDCRKPLPLWIYQAAADTHAARGDFSAAADRLRQAGSLFGEHTSLLIHLGVLEELAGNTQAAISCFKRAVEIEPENAEIPARLASALAKEGRLAEALSLYEEAQRNLELPPAWFFSSYADALRLAGDFDKAADMLAKALRIEPDVVPHWIYLGVLLENAGRLKEAASAYQEALRLDPGNADCAAHLASLEAKQGRLDRALALFDQAIRLSDKPSAWIYYAYGEALSHAGRLQAAVEALEKATELDPSDPSPRVALAKCSLRNAEPDMAIRHLRAAVTLKPDLPAGVYQELARLLKIKGELDLQARWTALVPDFEIPHAEVFDLIWGSLNQLSLDQFSKQCSEYPKQLSRNHAEIYFTRTSDIRIIDLGALSEEDAGHLKSYGLSPNYLRLNRSVNITADGVFPDTPERQAWITADNEFQALLLEEHRKSLYQLQTIAEGCVRAVCPWTGRILATNRSLLFDDKVCYRFAGEEVFYLLIVGDNAGKHALYFPKCELLVMLGASSPYRLEEEKLASFKARLVASWEDVGRYLSSSEKPRLAGVLSAVRNLGHHVWSDLSALDLLEEKGLLQRLKSVFVLSVEFYGGIEEIFPESLAQAHIYRAGHEEIFECIVRENLFAISLGYFFVRERLAKRLHDFAQSKCPPGVLDQLKEAKKCFPLLWITIRSHSRAWVDQEDGIPAIVSRLAQDYPSIGIILDGVSRIERQLGAPDEMQELAVEREKELACRIIDKLPRGIPVFDMVGAVMHESLTWAFAADLYLCHWGASVIKAGMIANKPGVVHANIGVLRLESVIVKCSSWLCRENGLPCVYIPEEHIREASGLVFRPDFRPTLDNYSCSWEVMCEALRLIVEKLIR